MTNTVTTRVIVDGPRHAVVHVYLKCDGASGELTDQVVVDVSTLAGAPALVTIEELWWNFIGFDAHLEFDATTDTPAWTLTGASGDAHKDFRSFGGIKDTGPTGTTGDVLLTTAGFTAATDQGTLCIKVRKD